MIDSHVHFWKYHPVKDAWIDETMPEIRRDFLPAEAEELWLQNGVQGAVAVQADPSEAETRFLVALAKEHPGIKGVVGWTDLLTDKLLQNIERFSDSQIIKGWRHLVQAEPKGFLENPVFRNNVLQLGKAGYTYDILIFQHQLPEVLDFVKSLPPQPLVLDHLGKPDLRTGNTGSWKKNILKLAEYPHVFCKISGLVTEAGKKQWTKELLFGYLQYVTEAFGTRRIMFGSDWPVVLLNSDYAEWCGIVKEFIKQFSAEEQQDILHQNAVNFYKLKL